MITLISKSDTSKKELEIVPESVHSGQIQVIKFSPRIIPRRHSPCTRQQNQKPTLKKETLILVNPFSKTPRRKPFDSITHRPSFKKLRLNSNTSLGQPSAALSFTSRSQEFFVRTISTISLIVSLSGNCKALTSGVLVSG